MHWTPEINTSVCAIRTCTLSSVLLSWKVRYGGWGTDPLTPTPLPPPGLWNQVTCMAQITIPTLSSVLLLFPTASQSMGLRGRTREDSDDKLCFSVTSISASSMLFRSAMLSLDLWTEANYTEISIRLSSTTNPKCKGQPSHCLNLCNPNKGRTTYMYMYNVISAYSYSLENYIYITCRKEISLIRTLWCIESPITSLGEITCTCTFQCTYLALFIECSLILLECGKLETLAVKNQPTEVPCFWPESLQNLLLPLLSLLPLQHDILHFLSLYPSQRHYFPKSLNHLDS